MCHNLPHQPVVLLSSLMGLTNGFYFPEVEAQLDRTYMSHELHDDETGDRAPVHGDTIDS